MNPSAVASNFSPFLPFGLSNFGQTLVLIARALISTIPADETKDPGKTVPKAILIGITIITVFYLTTNIVLFGVRPWPLLAQDNAPLASATTAILNANPR